MEASGGDSTQGYNLHKLYKASWLLLFRSETISHVIFCDGCQIEFDGKKTLKQHIHDQPNCLAAWGGSTSSLDTMVAQIYGRRRSKRRYEMNKDEEKKRKRAEYHANPQKERERKKVENN